MAAIMATNGLICNMKTIPPFTFGVAQIRLLVLFPSDFPPFMAKLSTSLEFRFRPLLAAFLMHQHSFQCLLATFLFAAFQLSLLCTMYK